LRFVRNCRQVRVNDVIEIFFQKCSSALGVIKASQGERNQIYTTMYIQWAVILVHPQVCKQITRRVALHGLTGNNTKIQDGNQRIEDMLMFAFWLFTEMLNRISCRIIKLIS
jgi:hypothetical protein